MEVLKTENIKEDVTDRDVLKTVRVGSDIEYMEHVTFSSDTSSNEVRRKTIKYERNVTEENITSCDTEMGIETEINDIKYELDIEEVTDRNVLSVVKVSRDNEYMEQITIESDISSNEVGQETMKYDTNIAKEKITPYDRDMGIKTEINDIKYELEIEEVTDRDVLSVAEVNPDIEYMKQMTVGRDISSNEVGRKTIKYETVTEDKITTQYDTEMGIKTEINDIKYELDIEEHMLSYKHLNSTNIEDYKKKCCNDYTEYTATKCYVLLDRLEFDHRQYVNEMETTKCEENVEKENTSDGSEMNIGKETAIQLGKYKLKRRNSRARLCQLEKNIEPHQSLLTDHETKDKLTLQIHNKVIHKGNVEYFKCQFCKYTSKRRKTLKTHVASKHNENSELYRHDNCRYKTKTKKDHVEHCKVQHNKKTEWYQCQYCDFKTKFKGNFVRHHSLKHDGPAELFFCALCDFKTKCKRYLVPHLKSKHVNSSESEMFHCELCDFKTKFKDYFARHHSLKHDIPAEFFYCALCDFKTKCKRYLLPHLKSKHVNSAEILHCELCDYKTKYKRYLLRHHKGKHDDSAEIFHCALCDFKTKCKPDLLRHHKRIHDDSAEIFHCALCDHKTKSKYRLLLHHGSKHEGLRHYKPHHDVPAKTFQCEACSFKTKYRPSFVRHQRLKHDNSLAVCHLCSYKTKCNEKLAEHLAKTHGKNGRCFQCSVCNYSFRRKYCLVQHLILIHGENAVWNECYSCGFRTKYKHSLLRHIRENHKN